MLEECPLCKVVKKAQQTGKYCAVAHYGGQKVIVLLEHLAAPSSEALLEAIEFLGSKSDKTQAPSTLSSDIREVPGHWGIRVMPVTWLQEPKAKYGTGNKPAA